MMLIFLWTAQHPGSHTEVDIPKIAVEACSRVKEKNKDKALAVARRMFEVEKKFDIPSKFRGMSLAAACLESAFNPLAKGDKSKKRKRYMAIGVLQLWPWWEKSYKVDRTNPEQSTEAWLKHIFRQIPRVKKRCRSRSKDKTFVQAWVHAIRAPKPSGRCKERPLHLRQMKKIRKIINTSLNTSQRHDKRALET